VYEPLAGEGKAAAHVVAFARGSGPAVTVATRLPVTLRRQGGWEDTMLPLPDSADAWRDVLTSRVHRGGKALLSDLTSRLPVALLVPEGRG
jgi:(1->4)-alpha-D-glucan 1-alpha-D-glucosylmutase